jgi:NADPH:quinone reductase-like Zn-dependent oxidoreductase
VHILCVLRFSEYTPAYASYQTAKKQELNMKAVAYKAAGSIERNDALVDVELPRPTASGRDILVEVKAVSVNPVDTKIRRSVNPARDEWKILGWDAVGKVIETGPEAGDFSVGDEVFYAGSLIRPGANSQFHVVDERIV